MLSLAVERRSFPLHTPLEITGHTFYNTEAVHIKIYDGEYVGRGEGIGVYYNGDNVDAIVDQLESVREYIEEDLTTERVQELLPAGGARNALDCAVWDLHAKRSGRSIWRLLNIRPRQLATVATIGIGCPKDMANTAKALSKYTHLKIKLSNEDPIIRMEAIRKARPEASLIVDVNQGWNIEELMEYLPALQRLGVEMIEQPLGRGNEWQLKGFESSVPIGADESCLDMNDYWSIADCFDVINIKLDKCGGLTEALKIAAQAISDGKRLMVGNMTGSSLSMAPAYVVGQYCQFIDIDGPLHFTDDLENSLGFYAGGKVSIPSPKLWG